MVSIEKAIKVTQAIVLNFDPRDIRLIMFCTSCNPSLILLSVYY